MPFQLGVHRAVLSAAVIVLERREVRAGSASWKGVAPMTLWLHTGFHHRVWGLNNGKLLVRGLLCELLEVGSAFLRLQVQVLSVLGWVQHFAYPLLCGEQKQKVS